MNKKHSSSVSEWSGNKVIAALFLVVNLFGASIAVAQTNTWDGSSSTNWNTAANWSLNLIPTSAHNVVIPNSVPGANDNPVISANAVCSTLALTGGGSAVSLSINSGISLTVTTSVSIGAGTGSGDNIILNVGAGSLSAASIGVTATGNANRTSGVTLSTGTITVSGSITMGDVNDDFTFTGNGTLNIGNTMTGGTFTPSTGTVVYYNAVQTVGAYTYNNLTLSGSGVKTLTGVSNIGGNFETGGTASATAASALTIGGSVTLGLNTTFTAGAFTHNVAGNWTNNGATFTNTGSTINLNGAAQIIGGSSSTNFNNLTLSGSNTKTFSIATVTDAKLIITTGVVANLGTLNHFANSLRIGGVGQPVGTSGSTSSPAVNTNDTFFAATSGFITVLTSVPSEIYYSRATGNWNSTTTWSTVSFASAVNLGGFPTSGDIVNIGGGDFIVTVNVNSACASMSYQGSVANSPTVSISPGITLNVPGAIDIPATGGFFSDVNTLAVGAGTLNAGSISFSAGGAFGGHALTISTGTATVMGDVTQAGTIPITISFSGAGLLQLGGAITDYVNLTPGTGTVEYYGTVSQIMATTILGSYNNVTLSGSGLKTTAGALNMDGAFTLGAGTSFTGGPFTHTVAGNWINNGTTFDNAGSTITLDGGAQTIAGTTSTTFNNLTLAGTASSTKTFGLLTTMDGMLSINSVIANLGAITTHQARALALNGSGQVSGTWGSNASAATNKTDTYFTPGITGEVIITNRVYFSRQTGDWNASASWSTVTYGDATNLGDYPVAGDIVNIGGADLTITVNVNPAACASLSFLGNSNFSPTVLISAGNALNVAGAIDIPAAGTLFSGGDTNTFSVGAGTLTAGSVSFSAGSTLFGGHALTISTGTATVNGDVTQGGIPLATINVTGSGLLRLRGAFLNSANCNCTFATGGRTSTVEYLGTTVAQSIGDFTYYNLTLNNTFSSTGQLSLVDNTTVSNILTMTSGRVNLDGNTFTLTRSASGALVHNFSSAAGWMYGGSINRAFPATGITIAVSPSVDGMLPLGTSSNFRPFFFGKTAPGGSSGTITMTHNDPGTTTTGLNIVDPSGGPNVILRNNSAWASILTGGGTAVFRILYGGTGLGTVTNLGHLRAMRLNDIIQTHIGATGSLTDPRVERNGLTVAQMSSTFYVGSTDSGSPLPIELLYFNAKLINDVVELSWSTASEKDNDFFTIERASNIEEFETVGDLIDGKGTSYEKSDYFTRDENPIYGRSYYRLKQTDYDGKYTYSDLQVVNYEGPRFSSLQVYPNPSDGNTLTILVTGLKEQASVPVQIYNIQGQKVYESILEVRTPGTLKYDVEFGSPLKQGLYIIKAGQTLQLTRKLIVD